MANPSNDLQTTLSLQDAKLLNRFYEPLHLLRMLNAERGPGEIDLPRAPKSRGFRLTCRRFLDDLSWVCDNKPSGETVCAVAAQDTPQAIVFWVTGRHRASFSHFEWVLGELKNASERENADTATIALEIANKSIIFSKSKIKNYQRHLGHALQKARDNYIKVEADGSYDKTQYERLIDGITALLCIRDDPVRLCYEAKLFRHLRTLRRLLHVGQTPETQSPFATLWHYLGRLGCWFQKCMNLVETAKQFSSLLTDATCDFLLLPKERKLPVTDNPKSGLMFALRRMLPADQQNLVQDLYDQLLSSRLRDFPGLYHDTFSEELKGRFHAEVYLMEHFFFNHFRFWGRDKYIGCSKPSCYCCSLYIRFHPGNFVQRPAHNNISVKWIPPLLLQLGEEAKQKHNLAILNHMNAYTRRDVREEIEEKIPRRERAPDSTTGGELFSLLSIAETTGS